MAFRLAVVVAILLSTPPLSDLDRAHAETHALKVQLLQVQEQLASCQIRAQTATLSEEQRALEARFREVLKPAESDVFDWTSLTFKPKETK